MIPSVTQVLAPYSDFSRVDPDVLENAARRGSEVHRICAAMLRGLWVPHIPDDCRGYVESFQDWMHRIKEVHHIEEEFVAPDKSYKGHPDMVVSLGDRMAIVDLKTPAAKSKTWVPQLAAYKYLVERSSAEGPDEPPVIVVREVVALRLRKDGSAPIADVFTEQELALGLRAFFGALAAWKFFNNNNGGCNNDQLRS